MLIQNMPINEKIWAVADLGDVIYHHSNEWVNSEFPTQHHIAVRRPHPHGGLQLSNDDLSINITISEVNNVDIAVIAFNQLLESIQEMVEGEE